MRSSQKAQSVIEYIIVFVLVGLGIAIMGPYAIRSIHGHMKAWEDAVDDSITDPLPDVDPSTLPVPKCACSPVLPHGCGLGGCGQLSMLYQRDCHPLGCAGTQIGCAENSSCCTAPVPVQTCGGCQSDGTCCTPWAAAGSGSCKGDEGCPVGTVASIRQCGGGVGTQTSCQPSSTCVFQCQGNIPDNSTPCPGAEVGLKKDQIWVPVNPGGCVPTIKCQSKCDPCFHLNATGDACDPDVCCNNGFCTPPPLGNEDCSCPDCTGGCPAGTCNQGSCGPGFCEQF